MCPRIYALLLSLSIIFFSNPVNADNKYIKPSLLGGVLNVKPANSTKHTQNDTKEGKIIPDLKDEESMAGAEAAVLIIVVIVVLSVIGMVVYFIRKFDQLNRSLPTYRYSSLKTEINGMYGPDDKMESQMLVSVSTEEEDDFDDEDDNLSPPTLLVKSQTVMPTKSSNGSVPVHHDSDFSSQMASKSEETTMDSDDELLQ